MTNEEFSNQFDILLNSYNIQAGFGEGASKQQGAGIALDEYEKSVLLTQAQDLIVKSYFDRTLNNQNQGFDDTARRQVDFSSLIKVKRYTSEDGEVAKSDDLYDDRGYNVALERNILFVLNEKLEVGSGDKKKIFVVVPINYREYDREMSKAYAQPLKKQAWRLFSNAGTGYDIKSEIIPIYGTTTKTTINTYYAVYNGTSWSNSFTKPTSGTLLGTISSPSEIPASSNLVLSGSYYIVNEPTTSDEDLAYVIRYVEGPTPIVLRDLPNDLSVDGVKVDTPCALNPILHMDILNKAFELAVTTRGGGTSIAQGVQRGSNQ